MNKCLLHVSYGIFFKNPHTVSPTDFLMSDPHTVSDHQANFTLLPPEQAVLIPALVPDVGHSRGPRASCQINSLLRDAQDETKHARLRGGMR